MFCSFFFLVTFLRPSRENPTISEQQDQTSVSINHFEDDRKTLSSETPPANRQPLFLLPILHFYNCSGPYSFFPSICKRNQALKSQKNYSWIKLCLCDRETALTLSSAEETMNNGTERRLNMEEEEEEEDDDANGGGHDAWERTYADERSWEDLQEDESGLLRPIDNKAIYYAQYRRRIRSLSSAASTARIQKGLIRYLCIVVDLSKAASEMDFRPSRMAVVAKHVEAFIREFFDQNPLSQIALVTIKDGVAHYLTDLGGSPESHIKALMGKLECSGESSLQNALDLVHGYLNQVPSYGHREVLILYSALSTCDPGDIMQTVQNCKQSKIRCSVIGLSAEIFICKHLSQETGGSYSVALDESHFKELILEHAPPPPAIAEYAIANLMKMGFPQRAAESSIAICSCHREAKVGGGYTCPRCKARVCELPSECRICGLTLISSPHLARSYHHLFPIVPFDEVADSLLYDPLYPLPKFCFGCQQSLLNRGNKPGIQAACPKCKQHFCVDCDIYIHESLHNCPGCESFRRSKPVSAVDEEEEE